MHEVVAGPQLAEIGHAAEQRVLRAPALRARVVRALAEHVGGGDERDAILARGEARGRRAADDVDLARGQERPRREHAGQAIGAALRIGGDHDAQAVAPPRADRVGERLDVLDRTAPPFAGAWREGSLTLGVAERARVLERLPQRAQIVDLDAELRVGAVVGQLERRQLEAARRLQAELRVVGDVRGDREHERARGAAIGVARLGIAAQIRDHAPARRRIDDHPARVRRDVARGRDGRVVKRGHQALDADEDRAALELLDQLARRLRRMRELVRVRAQARAHVAAAGRDRVAHRMQVHELDRAQRALRLRVEPAQLLDHVAEQLDAHGMRRERRVDVDDLAAHRERAGLVDHRRARPAAGDEQRRDAVALDRIAAPDGQPAGGELGGGGGSCARAPRPRSRRCAGATPGPRAGTASRCARRCSRDPATGRRTGRYRCVTLPTNGAPIYVRLWTVLNGTTYLAGTSPTPSSRNLQP